MILRFMRIGCLGAAVLIVCQSHSMANLIEYPHLDPNNSQDFVNLGDLINGQIGGIVVGDKIFRNFFYSTLPGDDMPDAVDVNVFGFQDPDGNWGVSFHGAFIDLPGGGPSDALLRFTVEVDPEALQRGWRITDAHLFAGGVGVGDNSVITIDESFLESNQTLNAFATTLGGPLEQVLSDWVYFEDQNEGPFKKLRVTKDIFAFAGDTNLPARTTVIDQSFSQELIPEPVSAIMFAMFGMGLAIRRPSRCG